MLLNEEMQHWLSSSINSFICQCFMVGHIQQKWTNFDRPISESGILGIHFTFLRVKCMSFGWNRNAVGSVLAGGTSSLYRQSAGKTQKP